MRTIIVSMDKQNYFKRNINRRKKNTKMQIVLMTKSNYDAKNANGLHFTQENESKYIEYNQSLKINEIKMIQLGFFRQNDNFFLILLFTQMQIHGNISI